MDYMNIILKGITRENERQFFTNYIIRKFKGSGQTTAEFYTGCRIAHGELLTTWTKIFAELVNDLTMNEDAVNIAARNACINLNTYTRGKYAGFMYREDLQFIATMLDDAENGAGELAPTVHFTDLLNVTDPETLAADIRAILPAGKPEHAAAVYFALHGNKLLKPHSGRSEAWRLMNDCFGDIGRDKGFHKWFYLDNGKKLVCRVSLELIEDYTEKLNLKSRKK